MKKPNGYNPKANVSGNFEQVELGGHKCVIVALKEQIVAGNQTQLVIGVDFAKEDKQAGYMLNLYNNDDRENKKWPASGTKYLMVNKYDFDKKAYVDEIDKKCNDFLASVEQSNNGFEVQWDDTKDFGKQFKGKLVGAVWGEEETEYNGKKYFARKIRYFCTYDSAEGKDVPKQILLKTSKNYSQPAKAVVDDDGVPF